MMAFIDPFYCAQEPSLNVDAWVSLIDLGQTITLASLLRGKGWRDWKPGPNLLRFA
jgi:hypothetical protein